MRFLTASTVLAMLALLCHLIHLYAQDVEMGDAVLSYSAKLKTRQDIPSSSTRSSRSSSGKPVVEVLADYPHDPKAFTQGLLLVRDNQGAKFFVESTGLYGKSTLRKVDITTGDVLETYALPNDRFGEGVALGPHNQLVLLTWRERRGYVLQLDLSSTRPSSSNFVSVLREFDFHTTTGEGWGIDFDGQHLVVSDGSSKILFWDPSTLLEVRRMDVTYKGQSVSQLNELEYVNGFLYANIWFQHVIIKIDPETAQVVSVFDCSALVHQVGKQNDHNAVLNGIAYDGEEDVFYLTGKLWSRMFKVRLLD